MGLAILAAQAFGSGETAALSRILSTFSVLLGGIIFFLAGVGIISTPSLLRLLHTTPDTIRLAGEYLRIVLIGLPFLAVYNVYSAVLRGIGDSKAPFSAVLLSSVVNVGLDILLVAVFHWGVAGAAIATVFSQAAMTIFLVLYSIKKYPVLRFRLCRKAICAAAFFRGCHFGIPPMLQASVSSMGSLVLQNFMNGFGTQTVAAITTAYRVDSIVMVPILNLGSGISTLVAQDYGSGRTGHGEKDLFCGRGPYGGGFSDADGIGDSHRRTFDRPVRSRAGGGGNRR